MLLEQNNPIIIKVNVFVLELCDETSYTDESEEQQLLSILINISCDRD
jgi:hypothetical protein